MDGKVTILSPICSFSVPMEQYVRRLSTRLEIAMTLSLRLMVAVLDEWHEKYGYSASWTAPSVRVIGSRASNQFQEIVLHKWRQALKK